MTNIYIRHANGQIMEVQNWDTLTDYGAMVMRPLSASEQERYLALKSTRLKDSDIWQVFHPKVLQSTSSSSPSVRTTESGKTGQVGDRPQPHSSRSHPSHSQPNQTRSTQSRLSPLERKSQTPIPVKSNQVSRHSTQPSRSLKEYPPSMGRTALDIEISTRELSKKALLHIIQKACGRDIEVLKGASRDDLLSLASGILPSAGVPVRVMPQLN